MWLRVNKDLGPKTINWKQLQVGYNEMERKNPNTLIIYK